MPFDERQAQRKLLSDAAAEWGQAMASHLR
jgi:hypothetical protein